MLHSFGRCRYVWNSLLLYACIAIVHDFPVYFSIGSVWLFRQCLIFLPDMGEEISMYTLLLPLV